MKKFKLFPLFLALVMLFSLAACGRDNTSASPSPTGSSSTEPTPSQSQPVESRPVESETPLPTSDPLRFTVISGPTGVGAAKLLNDIDNNLTGQAYEYTIAASNDQLTSMLANGETDIATMASNVALNYYNKTGGSIQVIALGTLGVLHILEGNGGESIHSVLDLMGKTILATGQGANPEYALRYILSENGLDPDYDVTIEFYTDPAEITAKLLSGEADCAMLPVPAATAAIAKSQGSVRAALDLTKEWNALDNGSQLVMTAVVARTEFLKENPEAVAAFLTDYAESIDYVNGYIAEASELVASYGITPSAAIAAKAIPQCHLVCITGARMQPVIDGYYAVLYNANPNSIGGSLPDDGFYYVP